MALSACCSARVAGRLGSVLPATALVASSDCALLVDGAEGVSLSDSALPLLRARLRSREVSHVVCDPPSGVGANVKEDVVGWSMDQFLVNSVKLVVFSGMLVAETNSAAKVTRGG